MEKMILFFLNDAQEVHLTKDVGAFPYYLAKICGWRTSFAYFADKPFYNKSYEYVTKLVYMGAEKTAEERLKIVKEYIYSNVHDIDCIMLIDCGRSTYQIANFCKHLDKNIKVYCKLDMCEDVFKRFYDGSKIRAIKNIFERRKHRNIDWFTVETEKYNNILQHTYMFKKRIGYLPNGVSLMDVNLDYLDEIEKENIILTVGRLGTYQKNNELLIEAVASIPDELLLGWKVYLVGPYTEDFYKYVMETIAKKTYLKNIIIFTGNIQDRAELYKIYAKAKVFTLTSRDESFGIATVEAMYFGAYPILTDFATVAKEIVCGEKIGRIVENYSHEKLRNAICDVMKVCDEKQTFIEVKKYAREKFSYEVLAKKLNNMLMALY